jgi:hypothetical protein
MDNKHRSWRQGQFIDQPKYRYMSTEWKQQCRLQESLLVRPWPLGNAICRAHTPGDALWIAQRLNLAATPLELSEEEIMVVAASSTLSRSSTITVQDLVSFAQDILKAANDKRGVFDDAEV